MAQQTDIKKNTVTSASGDGGVTGRIELESAGGRPETKEEEIRASARNISTQILSLTRNGLFVSLRFLDVALCQFTYVSAELTDLPFRVRSVATTGEHLVFDPKYIIEQYLKDKKALSRDYLHIVLHCIFRHPFVSSKLNAEYWNLACDIAVEATICELDLRQANVQNAPEIEAEISRIRGMVRQMTAEHLYRYFMSHEVSLKDLDKWQKLFTRDEHDIWWEVARRIEDEKRKRAEEAEKEEMPDESYEPEPSGNEEDRKENEDEEQEENGEEQDAGDNTDEDAEGEGEDTGEEADQEDGEEPPEEDFEDAAGESSDEEGEEDLEEEPDEEEPEPEEDEYYEEYGSTEGGEDPRGDAEGDPNSEHGDSGEESSGEGSGGGNPGDEPEQTDEEGADRDNDTDTSDLEGEDDGHKPENNNKDQQGEIRGQTRQGVVDDSDHSDPFGEQNQQGRSEDTKSGGKGSKNDTHSGEYTAASGGGGSESQTAWEHSGEGQSLPGSGDKDPNDRRMLDGGVNPEDEIDNLEGEIENKREAKAERGTNEMEQEQDKAPAYMHNGEEQQELEDRWKEISERVLVDLETSSKEWGDKSDSMVQGLKKINRDKYDYRTFLQKFSTLKEDIQLNDDEFDYVYYTFGLDHYGNIPLVEPLEYKEVKKVRDFVIAIDTSGSCAGEVVQKFLDKTYSIFEQQENFFRKINLHIIQCDATIQSDVKITNKEEFKEYMRNLEFHGFGGTDFRPVFAYVNEMLDRNEFEDLKGLIYFTDGNGTYPKKRPPYETAFIFVDDDEFDYKVPSWAMKLVLETSDITEEVLI